MKKFLSKEATVAFLFSVLSIVMIVVAMPYIIDIFGIYGNNLAIFFFIVFIAFLEIAATVIILNLIKN